MNELKHYGVLGMRWGVRRAARKDAKEYARAKMFYGEGAGNRRKLIKARVEQRKKNDPEYRKEFEKALEKQDMSKHASGAKRERGIIDLVSGDYQKMGATVVGLYGVYRVGEFTGINQKVYSTGRKLINKQTINKGKRAVQRLIRGIKPV